MTAGPMLARDLPRDRAPRQPAADDVDGDHHGLWYRLNSVGKRVNCSALRKFTVLGTRPTPKKIKAFAAALGAGLVLTCAARASAAEPNIVITAPQPGDFDIGQPIEIQWQAADIPDGASLVLYAVSADGVVRHAAGGPLFLKAVPLADGKGTFVWDGVGVGCIPTDAPMFCTIFPGRYRLGAEVFDRGVVRLFPSMFEAHMGLKHENPKVVATAQTGTLTLRGPPDYKRFMHVLRSHASGALTNVLIPEAVSTQGLPQNIARYTREERSLREVGDNNYCLKFVAIDPFSGWIEACRRLPEDPVVRSEPVLRPGVMSYLDADKLARETVMRKCEEKARPDLHTRVEIHENQWVYKSRARTARPHWGIEYFVSEVGGRGPLPDRFSAVVYVKVFNDGTTEILELPRLSYANRTSVDIWKEDY
jgi:hypothetical protein